MQGGAIGALLVRLDSRGCVVGLLKLVTLVQAIVPAARYRTTVSLTACFSLRDTQ